MFTKTNKILTAAVAAATLVGGIAAGSEASAQSRYYRHRDNSGAAVAAGIAGLAVGAALASNNRGYYSSYSYGPSYGYGYGYAPSYYGSYYAPRYYAPRPYYRGYARSCVYWQYDRWGRAYQVRGRC